MKEIIMKTNAHITRIVQQHRTIYKTNIDLEFSETSYCVYVGYWGHNEPLRQSLLKSLGDKTTTVRCSQANKQTRIYIYRDYEDVNGEKHLI